MLITPAATFRPSPILAIPNYSFEATGIVRASYFVFKVSFIVDSSPFARLISFVRSTALAYGVKSTSSIVIKLESFVRLDTFVGISVFFAYPERSWCSVR
jgi:hypothetical protein